jgi:hypothetical protein
MGYLVGKNGFLRLAKNFWDCQEMAHKNARILQASSHKFPQPEKFPYTPAPSLIKIHQFK